MHSRRDGARGRTGEERKQPAAARGAGRVAAECHCARRHRTRGGFSGQESQLRQRGRGEKRGSERRRRGPRRHRDRINHEGMVASFLDLRLCLSSSEGDPVPGLPAAALWTRESLREPDGARQHGTLVDTGQVRLCSRSSQPSEALDVARGCRGSATRPAGPTD